MGKAVVWKLINKVVVERVVEYKDLFTLPFWSFNMNTEEFND